MGGGTHQVKALLVRHPKGPHLRLATVNAAATGSNTPSEAAMPLPEPVGHVAKGTRAARSQSGRLSRP